MMTPFTPLFIVTSLYDVCIERMVYDDTFQVTMIKGMKGVIVLHPLNNYFIQRGHNEKRYERCHRTPSPQ
jgi:hypothetical protein